MPQTRANNNPPSTATLIEARLLVTKADKALKDKKKKGKKIATDQQLEKENDDGSEVPAKAVKRKVPAVSWSKPSNYHFTDTVLTIIEASPPMKVCFGLDKGDALGTVNSGGKKAKDHHETIARSALLESDKTLWIEDDIPALVTSIKNRIPILKTSYITHKNEMSETGQGLVHSGRADKMIDDSDIKNSWDKVLREFPWYERMHALMGTSPVATHAAVAHSTTPIDTSILDRNKGGERARSASWDQDLDMIRSRSGSPINPGSPFGSPTLDDDIGDAARHSSIEAPTPTVSKKRKSLADTASNIAEQERVNRRKISDDLAREKTRRSTTREQIKHDAHVNVEIARMNHDKNEAEARRAHDLVMMDKQMELEHFRVSNSMAGPSSSTLHTLDPGLWPNR